LCHIARLFGDSHLPQRCRVNQVCVTPHNLTERLFGLIRGVIAEEFSVALRLHFTI
jgi:hypothetical protein